MAEKNNSNHWTDKLLELNKKKNINYSEIYDLITDLEIYCKVGKEEVDLLKNEIEKKEIEYKYKVQIAEEMRELNEQLDNSRKKSEELIEYKRLTNNLKNNIYDLEKQKWAERNRQSDLLERQWYKACENEMKLMENNPLVMKRNHLRSENAKLKFQLAFAKQKLEELHNKHKQFKKIEKQIQQRHIIQFAEAMVKYYKKQKERNEIVQNEIQEFKLPTTGISKLNLLPSRLSTNNANAKKNIEAIDLNIKSFQFSSLNLLNHNFDTNRFSSVLSKPEMHKEIPKTMTSNLTIPKLGFASTLSKIKIDQFIKPEQKNNMSQDSQKPNTQKQEIRNPPETIEFKSKNNNLPVLKMHSPEKHNKPQERLFLSQDDKNSSQSNIHSSQKSTTSTQKKLSLSQNDNTKYSKQIKMMNTGPLLNQNISQIFSFTSTKPTVNETPKHLEQIFNFPSAIKKVENSTQNQVPNPMFNLPTGTTERMEIISETPQFPQKPSKPLETKSPYFPTQSTQNSANTSADNSDQIVNVSSDQNPSQISGDEFGPSPNNMDIQDRPMMEYNDADPNMMEYFEENRSNIDEQEPFPLHGFTSPPGSEHDLRINQPVNSQPPASNNLFTSNSNNFFNFGQSNNTKSGSIFNLF